MRNQWVTRNPAEYVEHARYERPLEERPLHMDVLTPEEVAALREAATPAIYRDGKLVDSVRRQLRLSSRSRRSVTRESRLPHPRSGRVNYSLVSAAGEPTKGGRSRAVEISTLMARSGESLRRHQPEYAVNSR
jgi:hypothetical protein